MKIVHFSFSDGMGMELKKFRGIYLFFYLNQNKIEIEIFDYY